MSQAFLKNIGERNLSLVFGKSAPEASGDNPSQKTGYRSPQDAEDISGVVGVNLSKDNSSQWFSLIARNIQWTRGAIYDAWDNTKVMDDKNFYAVVTDEFGVKRVYWCLDNNYGALSTSPPSGTNPAPKRTSDGYLWSYLYTISGQMSKFVTSKHIPVPSIQQIDDLDLNPVNSNNPLKLARDTINYWNSRPKSIIRFTLPETELRRVRFATKPVIKIIEITDDPCTFDITTEHFTNSWNSSEDGHKLIRIEVKNPGKNYTQSFNNLYMNPEPQYPADYSANLLVGNSQAAGLQGPLIYIVLSPDGLDFATLLGADSGMVVYSVDSSRLAQITDATSFNKVSLVENLYDYNGDFISNTKKGDSPFRMSTRVTVDTGSVLANNASIASSQINANSKRALGRIAHASSDTKTFEVIGDGKNLAVNDKLFSASTLPPSTRNTRSASLSWSGKHTASTNELVGAATDLTTVQSIQLGNGKLGPKSEILHTQTLTTTDSITSGLQSYQVRLVIGDNTGNIVY